MIFLKAAICRAHLFGGLVVFAVKRILTGGLFIDQQFYRIDTGVFAYDLSWDTAGVVSTMGKGQH